MAEFKSFLKKNRNSFLLTTVCICIAYGMKLFFLSISHDTEAIISVPDSLYNSWVSMGRYGLLIVKKVLGLYQFNPYLAAMLMFLAMIGGVIVWQYLFYLLTPNKEGFEKRSWIWPIFFYTAPVMAEQISFMLQAFEVCLIILLTGCVLLLVWKAFLEKKYWYSIFCVLLLALCFSCYQAVLPLFIAASVATFLLYFSRQDRYWSAIFWLIGHFVVGYGIYEIGNRIAIKVMNQIPTNYLTDQILWGKESIGTCVMNILRHMKQVLLFENVYYSAAFLLAVILGIATIFFMVRKKKKHVYLYVLCMGVLFLCPFLMTILLGQKPAYRTEIILPFVFGFLIQYFLGEWNGFEKRKTIWVKYVVMLASAVFMYQQISTTTNMFYTEHVQYEEDVRTAVKISDRIDQLNLGQVPLEPVVFIGAKLPQLNKSASRIYENPGHSFYEWSFTPKYGTFIMRNFMATIGYPYAEPTDEQVAIAEKEAQNMPLWPDTGSVIVKDGIIIVRIS